MTESLYRKYRPQTFADVVGQDAIERTLRNALAQNKVSHAYLFCGPRGTGKTTTARLMAKAILCEKGVTPDPDGTCESCQMIAEGTHPDVYELDAASRTGVDNVREEIIGRVNFAPTVGRAKIYIIDEVHMLSTAAFNALLKTLEEPPDHVVFILCTTDPNKVPATIHSRCQRFDFHRISVEEIVARLGAVCVAEDVTFEPEALELIAERSDGGMRNALTSLEQLMVFSEGNVTRSAAEDLLGSLDSSDMAEIVGAIGRRDAAACFVWLANYVETGADLAQFARDLAEHIRALYILGLMGDDAPLEISGTERAQLVRELPYFGTDRLARLLMILGDLMNELRTSTNPRLSFEIALTRMVHPSSDLTLESLAERIETLEKGMAARPVAPAAPAPAAAAAAPAAPAAPAAAPPQAAGLQEAPAPHPATAAAPGAASADVAEAARNAARAAAARAKARIHAGNAASHNGAASRPQASVPPVQAPARPAVRPQTAPDDLYEDYNEVPDDYLPAEAYDGMEGGAPQPAPAAAPRPSRPAAAHPVPNGNPPAVPAATSAPAPATPGAPASSGTEPPRVHRVPAEVGETLANPAALQRGWQATMAALKKEKAAYGVLFLNTTVSAKPAEGTIVVSFPATARFAYMSVRKPEVYDALERATAQGFGSTVNVQFEQEGAAASAAPDTSAAPAPAAARPMPARPTPARPRPYPASQPAAAASQSAPVPRPMPRPAPAPRPVTPPAPAAPAPQAAPEPQPAAAPTGDTDPQEEGDFASMLEAGFGAGVTFEEVDGGDVPDDNR